MEQNIYSPVVFSVVDIREEYSYTNMSKVDSLPPKLNWAELCSYNKETKAAFSHFLFCILVRISCFPRMLLF
jgi:hypothetical protein